MITDEKRLELIGSCLSDIRQLENDAPSAKYEQHLKLAIDEYARLYEEAKRGRIDLDLLHENISSFLYVQQ